MFEDEARQRWINYLAMHTSTTAQSVFPSFLWWFNIVETPIKVSLYTNILFSLSRKWLSGYRCPDRWIIFFRRHTVNAHTSSFERVYHTPDHSLFSTNAVDFPISAQVKLSYAMSLRGFRHVGPPIWPEFDRFSKEFTNYICERSIYRLNGLYLHRWSYECIRFFVSAGE